MPLQDLQELLDAVERGRARCPLTRGTLQSMGLGHLWERLETLQELDQRATAAVLSATVAERRLRPVPRLELVWTGPEAASSPARDTAVVLRKLFDGAERSVLVAGYSFDHGADILRHLWRAMQERGVSARVVLHVPPAGRERVEAAVALAVTRFVSVNWPFGTPMPELWYDPRTVAPGSVCSMHAKCVVADEEVALVGSANFTDRGHERNIEVGVLIEDPRFARRLVTQWNGLVAAGLLARAA